MTGYNNLRDLQILYNNAARIASFESPAVSAQNSRADFWNVGGSGVLLIVTSICVTSPTAGVATLGRVTGATTTATGNTNNKLIGGTAPTNRIFWHASASWPSTVTMGYLLTNNRPILFNPPIVLPAGNGLHIAHLTLNTILYGQIEFIELPI